MFFAGSNITFFTFHNHLWPIYWLSLVVVCLAYSWTLKTETVQFSATLLSASCCVLQCGFLGCLHIKFVVLTAKKKHSKNLVN
jgi:hypothetical protein